MSAEVHLTGRDARRVRRTAVLAVLAVGWCVAGLCFARDREAGMPALVALIAALAWWPAVVAVVRSDLADYVIPDGASAFVALLGLAQAVALPLSSAATPGEAALAGIAALGTGAGAFLLFWAVGALVRRIGGRDALGFGDVKLAGASAIWLSPGDAALALEIAAFGAIAVLIAARRRGAGRDTAVPFGAFMAPAAWLVYLMGPVVRDLLS